MSWVDLTLLALLLLSVLVGVWRGLVFELLSLAGWLVAYLAAPHVAPWLQTFLPQQRLGASLSAGLGLVLSFALVLLLWGLAAKLLRALVHASPLSVLDRLAGAGFGAVRGLLLALFLVVLVQMTPAAQWPAWQESRLAPQLHQVLGTLRPLLPDAVASRLPA